MRSKQWMDGWMDGMASSDDDDDDDDGLWTEGGSYYFSFLIMRFWSMYGYYRFTHEISRQASTFL